MDDATFDFIICGGGTAGCVIASRLAEVLPTSSILLVESGRDSGIVSDVLIPGKYIHQLSEDKEGLWELPTVPQKELNGRELVFLRGKQLGGSSAVNYMAMARGPADDYDEWAKRTGDDSWKWENILPLMKELEDFRPSPPAGFEKYAEAAAFAHGQGGPISIGFGDIMVPGVEMFIHACVEQGMPVCMDNNSGNPIGVGLAQFNVGNGERSYAANSFLQPGTRERLKNLTVLTSTACDRILFRDNKAIGVELYNYATKEKIKVKSESEVIVCGGTFGSPHLLMLSGIGPREELRRHAIEVVADVPAVGNNMLDHSILTCEFLVDPKIPAHNQVFADPTRLTDAEAQYAKNKTGPLAEYGSSGAVAFPKIESLYTSTEFKNLDEGTQEFLLEQTRPSAEIWLGSGPSAFEGEVNPEDSYMTFECLLQNNLSRGSISLSSKNPRDLAVINPKFLDDPYDRRIAIETIRKAIEVAQSPAYRGTIRKMVHGPGSSQDLDRIDVSDSTILDFVRKNLGQGYHSMSTCKMGMRGDSEAVVDNHFKLIGVDGLRVADLSVCPILTCNHTQINAYLIGEKCAREVIAAVQNRTQTARL